MRRILFIITQAELGGAQRWVYDVAVNLKDKYEVTVAAGDTGPLLQNLKSHNIRTFCFKHLKRNINPIHDFLGILEIYRFIKNENPDALQLCSAKAGFIGSIAGRMAGVKEVIYRNGGWSFNDPRPQWQNLIFLWLERLTSPLKNKIIVNSQKGYDEALKYKICSKKKLFLLYNGIQINDQAPKTNDQNNITIGAIANFYKTKGVEYLVRAANILQNPNLEFFVIGDGPERKNIEFLIDKFHLNNFHLLGQQENPWKILQEKNVNLFVIPSLKEGMPYVLLEAMTKNLPIIAAKVGGIPEIIESGKNGLLIKKGNPQELASAIETLIGNQTLREALAKKALQDIQKFQLSDMISKYISIIES